MPQRHRPRLNRYTIACSWCGASTVKLYPSRESVRRKLSPYQFCSSTCQRDHWEARRKAEWSGAPYPCAQCGTAITPQQAAGRRRSYCNDTCKQKAARERRRRNPAGAVMAARQQFKDAWHDAVKAAEEWEKMETHGAPVKEAYMKVEIEFSKYPNATNEQKRLLLKPIADAAQGLHGESYAGEPNRREAARGLWVDWWEWWKKARQRCESAYENRLEVARASTEELRKKERVAARRAETARLRRAAAGQDRDTSVRPYRIPEASER